MQAKKLPSFKKWLQQNGAELLMPTNPYEVIRFRCRFGTGVIYQGKKGINVNDKFVTDAYRCFVDAKPWAGKGSRINSRNKEIKQLISRDGYECFYCGQDFIPKALTQEHVLSLVQGGVDRIENKVLSCKPCNNLAGHLPIIEKVRLRDKMRAENERNQEDK